MKISILNFIINFLQRLLVSITSNVIIRACGNAIKWIILIILAIVLILIILQYYGIYDVKGQLDIIIPKATELITK